MKVIFHIDESEKWPMVVSNVKNLISYYTKKDANTNIKIEVLVNGDAVSDVTLRNKKYHEAIENMLSLNVDVAVCNNSLMQRKISSEELLAGLVIVQSGVVELVEKQNEGYSYIKP